MSELSNVPPGGSELRRALENEFRAHESTLWNIAYRLTGTVEDADDVLQETFARALSRPPADTSAAWFPWLLRVAMNVGRDLLRYRKRRRYVGPWLPAPLETDDAPADDTAKSPEQRYDLAESASFAFLLALEVLPPKARAVVVLRDVFELSVEEAADALDLTVANVRTTHHRARAQLARYDRERSSTSAASRRDAQDLFARFLAALREKDVDTVRALLAEDVCSVTDANGEYIAAARPLVGGAEVARFFLGLARLGTEVEKTRFTTVNGMPALLFVFGEKRRKGDAPRALLRVETREGRITRFDWILATKKLARIRF